jgi:hypothetical protein
VRRHMVLHIRRLVLLVSSSYRHTAVSRGQQTARRSTVIVHADRRAVRCSTAQSSRGWVPLGPTGYPAATERRPRMGKECIWRAHQLLPSRPVHGPTAILRACSPPVACTTDDRDAAQSASHQLHRFDCAVPRASRQASKDGPADPGGFPDLERLSTWSFWHAE